MLLYYYPQIYSNRPGNEREGLEGEELEGEGLERKGLKGFFFLLAFPKKNLDFKVSISVALLYKGKLLHFCGIFSKLGPFANFHYVSLKE